MATLKVRAHWTSPANPIPASLAAYGTPPSMATTPPWPPTPVGPVPATLLYHVWCPLVAQADLDSAQWGAHTVPPPPAWPLSSGAPAGTYDQGYGGGAVDFAVTALRLWIDGEGITGLTYTITAPNGTVLPTITPPAPGWTAVPVAAPINSGKGIWRIDVNRAPGTSVQAPGLVTGTPAAAGGVDEPYVVRYAINKSDSVLGLEFTGGEVSCRDIKVTGPGTACVSSGQSVTVTFTASFTPPTPPYTGAVNWQVRDGNGNTVPLTTPTTASTLIQTFTQKGSYRVTATIIQMGCPNPVPSDTDVINIVDCTCPSIIGSPNGIQVTQVSGCTFAFSVQIANPSGATLTFTWDFGDGTGPHILGSSVTYTYPPGTSGTITVTVTVATNDPACGDTATTQVTVNCPPITTTTTATTTSTSTATQTGTSTGTTTTTATTTSTSTATQTGTSTGTTTPTTSTTPTITTTSTSGPFGLCGFALLLALILLGIAAVGLAIGGCLASAGITAGAVPIAASGLVVLGLWIAFCHNCPLMRFLQRYFGVMALVLVGLAAILAMIGMVGCSAGAAAVATLFGVIVGALSIGIRVFRCP